LTRADARERERVEHHHNVLDALVVGQGNALAVLVLEGEVRSSLTDYESGGHDRGAAGARHGAQSVSNQRRSVLGATRRLPFHSPAALVLPEERSEEHTSELQSLTNRVCRLLL